MVICGRRGFYERRVSRMRLWKVASLVYAGRSPYVDGLRDNCLSDSYLSHIASSSSSSFLSLL